MSGSGRPGTGGPADGGADRAPGARRARVVARGVVGALLLVVAAVLAWWLLAPQPPVVTDGTQRVSPGLPELAAAQDGVFVLVTAVAGLLTGWGVVRAGPTAPRVVVVVLLSAARAWLTSVAGSALGSLVAGPRRSPALPDGVTDQLAQGVAVAPSRLLLSSDVAIAVWPLLATLVVTAVLVGRLLRAPTPAAEAG
ncbi:hypothetical protein [Pseudokineococcus basanitobsidens]|uniref:hypothetical protein n=1 Tax=Pseudokineococcus basanitobsidens TaxID=1926649 RepID=UPI0030DD1918